MTDTSRPAVRLVLASGSAIRAAILTAAGVSFEAVSPGVDETSIKEASVREGLSLEDTARRLADAKALAVAAPAEAFVLGSDQILECEGEGFDKPASLDEARARLVRLQGRVHSLLNAVSIAREGRIVFRNFERPRLFMRSMEDAEIDAYIKAAGPDILYSVGAYQVEGLGARLFERIEGDYFAVLGLSLFPVLGFLRQEKLIDF